MKFIATIATLASVNAADSGDTPADKTPSTGPRCDFDLSKPLGHSSKNSFTNTLDENGLRTITNPGDGQSFQWYGLKPGVDIKNARCDFKVISLKKHSGSGDNSWLQIGQCGQNCGLQSHNHGANYPHNWVTANIIYPEWKKNELQSVRIRDKWPTWNNQLTHGSDNKLNNVSVMNNGNEMYWQQTALPTADQKKPYIAFTNESSHTETMWWPNSSSGNGEGFDVPKQFRKPSDYFRLDPGKTVIQPTGPGSKWTVHCSGSFPATDKPQNWVFTNDGMKQTENAQANITKMLKDATGQAPPLLFEFGSQFKGEYIQVQEAVPTKKEWRADVKAENAATINELRDEIKSLRADVKKGKECAANYVEYKSEVKTALAKFKSWSANAKKTLK